MGYRVGQPSERVERMNERLPEALHHSGPKLLQLVCDRICSLLLLGCHGGQLVETALQEVTLRLRSPTLLLPNLPVIGPARRCRFAFLMR